MKIGVYNQTITYKTGGTESYTALLIQSLQNRYPDAVITIIAEKNKSHHVSYSPEEVVTHINSSFGTNVRLNNIRVKEIVQKNYLSFFLKFYRVSSEFDLFFNCSVNMLLPRGKRNISITHFPDKQYQETHFAHRFPLFHFIAKKLDDEITDSYSVFLCNSQFTAGWLKKRWHVESNKVTVLYPPVSMINQISGIEKENQILICSRIEESKKIESLIKAYKMLNAEKYSLVIAGGCTLDSDKRYCEILKKQSEGLPVSFYLNIPRDQLEKLFLSSKIFWHAKGIDIDENKNPYMLEHFGITTVEAMSAGCVPVVINKGGQKEIVDEGINGYRWNTIDELTEKTRMLINDKNLLQDFSVNAKKKSFEYSADAFNTRFIEI
jgi:glycosyltransferase involved in cell wall biosynthesis